MRELLFFLYTVSCYSIFFPLIRDMHLGKTTTPIYHLKKLSGRWWKHVLLSRKGTRALVFAGRTCFPFYLKDNMDPKAV